MSGHVLFSGGQPFGDSMSQTILVTGASSGIGQATARLLAERGFKVFGTARKPESAQSQGVTMVALDVRSDESVRSCVQQVVAKAGRLDVLVNNAGYSITGAAEETSVDEAKAQLETNFFGAVRMVNAVLPGMRAAARARSSTSARSPATPPFRTAPFTRRASSRSRDIPSRCGTRSARLASA